MCVMSINQNLNGIELKFESKPSAAVRESMKAAGFRWHSQKCLWYAKNTADRLALAEKLSRGAVAQADPVIAPTTASAPVNKYGVKVGDILACSWGYSMTIVEFYKVTKILSATKIEIVELAHKTLETDCGGGEDVMPDLETPIGDPLVKMVCQNQYEKSVGQCHVKINSSVSLRKWSGRAMYQNRWD